MSNLGNQASKCSLDKVADALPPALKKSVLQSLNFSTFVWVIKNKDDANKIVKVLRENGFSNISLDSKGTTITAQSSSGSQSAGNDDDSSCKGNKVKSCNNQGESTCNNSWQVYGSCGNQCVWDAQNERCVNAGGEDNCPTCCGTTNCIV